MRTCSPSEFLTRWPGSLHPVALPDPSPALPEGCHRCFTECGLPGALTIYCYKDIPLRFSGSVTPLAAIFLVPKLLFGNASAGNSVSGPRHAKYTPQSVTPCRYAPSKACWEMVVSGRPAEAVAAELGLT